jgi:hypothetical protein
MDSILQSRNGAGFLTVASIAPDYYGGGFPPLQAHRLVAAAWCRIRPAAGSTKQDAVFPEFGVDSLVVNDLTGEPEVLSFCRDWLGKVPTALPIGTFYGELFTWPVLCWRACSHARPFPTPLGSQRFDLADYTTFGFDSKRLSISDCAEAMGLPKRFTTDIQDRYFAQDYESILGFVETDLLIYSLCWLRFLLVAGALTRAQFTATGHFVMKILHGRSQMAKEYIKQFDYRKFLLLPAKKEPSCS